LGTQSSEEFLSAHRNTLAGREVMGEGRKLPGLYEKVQAHAARYPSSPALLHRTSGETKVTCYADLTKEASRFAAAFEASTPPNAIIPLYLSKSSTCVAAMVGALGAGRAFAYLNKKLRVPQLEDVVTQTRAKTVLIDGPGIMVLGNGSGASSSLRNTEWWIVRDHNYLPPHGGMAATLREKGWILRDLAHLTKEPTAAPTEFAEAERVGCCLFTSGSTGTPKGVLISARDLSERAQAEVRLYHLERTDVLLSVLPFSFDVGLNQLLSGLTVGCSLVLLDSWLPADIRKTAAECRVTGISGVPSLWQDMMRASLRFDTETEHSSLRFITVSGGDLLPHQLEQLTSLAPGCEVFKTYGQTETFRSTALHPGEYQSKKQSVGRPFEGARVYVASDGRRCAPGEVGEVIHTGLGTMIGYLDGEDPQRKLRPNPFLDEHDHAAVAVFTGDLGFVDEEGYLFLKGRRDAMLKVEGNRVYPQEISAHIAGMASVSEAHVVGAVDEGNKLRLVAFVVLSPGAALEPQQFRRDLLLRLPSYMVPNAVVVLEDVPRTASGKPDMPALKAKAERHLHLANPSNRNPEATGV
jgi:acyl-CoA synthetase (AMP-forming)/AMP-acid ligase II